MILYHGTTYNNFKKIYSDKEIIVTNDENSPYKDAGSYKTTEGYVYLSSYPLDSLEFASKSWLTANGDGCNLLVILKIELDEAELENDEDEERINSSSFKEAKQYRIKRNINYLTDVKDLAFFGFKNFQDSCDFFENKRKIVWISKERKWNGNFHAMGDKILEQYEL